MCLFFSFPAGVNVEQWPGLGASTPSNVTELRSTVNVSVQFVNIDDQQCSQELCNSNGHCVKADEDGATITCVCSQGYSGDSCEEPFLQAMPVPIIYTAAVLCVGAVLIAVIAAVVKRTRNADMRFCQTVLLH